MGIVQCRSEVTAAELARAELRVQELEAENERLRRCCHLGLPQQLAVLREQRSVGEQRGTATTGAGSTAYLLVPPPANNAAGTGGTGGSNASSGNFSEAAVGGPPNPPLALAPEDLQAMLSAVPPPHDSGAAAIRPPGGPGGAMQRVQAMLGAAVPLLGDRAAEHPDASLATARARRPALQGRATDCLPSLPRGAPVMLRLGRMPGSREDRGLGSEQQLRFLREVQILGAIHHEHLVPVQAFCMPCLALVHPWPERGSLGDLLCTEQPPNPTEGFQILLGAARGLCALHKLRMVHRDIRSACVFLFCEAEGAGIVAKLGDCGLTCEPADGVVASARELVGTLPYTDPIHLQSGRFFKGSDIFSLGVVLLEVLLGCSAERLAEPDAVGEQAGMGTRRPRTLPLWKQFVQQLPNGQPSVADAAVELVLQRRPRRDWSRKALLAAAELLTDMLKVDFFCKGAGEAPLGRPTSATVVDHLEAVCGLQDVGPTLPRGQRRRERICVVCMDASIDTRLQPCGHSALCQGCAAVFVGREEPCAICRTPVAGYEEGDFNCTYVQ